MQVYKGVIQGVAYEINVETKKGGHTGPPLHVVMDGMLRELEWKQNQENER